MALANEASPDCQLYAFSNRTVAYFVMTVSYISKTLMKLTPVVDFKSMLGV